MNLDSSKNYLYDNAHKISTLSKQILVFTLLFVVPTIGSPQILTLFEETDTNLGVSREEQSRAARRDSDGNLITGPEFTLVGTARIGRNSLVVLKDRLGEIISINMSAGASTSIPSHSGFQIVDVGSGNAAIQFPNDSRCVEFLDQGVGCETDNIARLVLTNAKPLERASGGAMLNSGSIAGSLPQGVAEQENESNPFEAILQRAANPDSGVEGTAFEPRRIKPEDVPPGMRVVSTPFGDRLVEQE